MATQVDERIVEARFDSGQFEKGVDKTVKKLDELKDALAMKDTGKKITEFAKDSSEGIEKVGNALDKLSNRLTTFKGMIKQQILSGLAQEVSNVFLSIEHSIKGFVTSLSSAQVSAGMNKYTEILNSVRTMTAAGVGEGVAYDKIKRLALYSDQTSYSLNQMTSGMSKLVAAGIDIDKAEKSMEGLANMCASAGVNVNDANRAFYNFSQAISSGSMQIKDWMSFENLNMATQNINKVFMAAAEQTGTLKKTVDKNGKEIYKTLNKTNKKVKAGKEVTAENFRNTLSYGWLDKDTMVYATSVLAYFEDLGKSVDDLTDEDLKNFAAMAYTAAKEARSFADVMGTLKDVVATGWATSFEHIFGRLDEAKKFFTWLTESEFANAIYAIGEFRNEMLSVFGEDVEHGGIYKTGRTGRDSLFANEASALKNLDKLLGAVREGFAKLFPEYIDDETNEKLTFAQKLGKDLAELSFRLQDASYNLLSFFAYYEDTVDKSGNVTRSWHLKDEYVERFRKIAEGLGSVFGIAKKLFDTFTATISRVWYEIQPILDGIGNAIGIFLQPFTDLNNQTGEITFFDKLKTMIDNLFEVIHPFIEPAKKFIEFLGEVGAFFLQGSISMIETNIDLIGKALGFLIEIFGGTSSQKAKDGIGVIEGWKQSIKDFGETCKNGFNAVKDFFTALFDDLRTLFGIGKDKVSGKVGGFFENISNFFKTNEFVKKIKDWINQAITDIVNWVKDIPNKVNGIVLKISDFIHGIFYTKDENGKEIETPFKQWLNQTIQNIINWLKELPGKVATAIKNFAINIGTFFHNLFYTKDDKGNEIKTPLKEWIDNTIVSIIAWIKELPGKIATGIKNFAIKVGDFFHNLFYTKDDKGEEIKTPLKEWLDITIASIITWLKELPGNIIKGIKNFVVNIGNFFHGLFYTKDDKGEEIKTPLKEWLDNTIHNIVEWIKSLPQKIRDGIHNLYVNVSEFLYKLFYAKDDNGKEVETPFNKWLKNAIKDIKAWIKSIPGKIVKGIRKLGDIAGKIWTSIIGFIFGNGKDQSKEVEEAIDVDNADSEYSDKLQEKFSNVISGLIDSIKDWIKNIPQKIGNLWNTIYGLIFGDADDPGILSKFGFGGFADWIRSAVSWIEQTYNEVAGWPIWETLKGFLGNIGQWIKEKVGIVGDFFFKPDQDTKKTGFTTFLEQAVAWINLKYLEISGWPIWDTLGKFFSDIGAWIADKCKIAYEFFTKPDQDTGKTGFISWIESAVAWIKLKFWEISEWQIWKDLGKFFSDIGAWIADKCKIAYEFFTKPDQDTGKTGFISWIESAVAWIKLKFWEISDWQIWKDLGKFFGNIGEWIRINFAKVSEFFTEPKVDTGKTGFVTWLENLGATFEGIFNKVKEAPIWQELGQFFTDIFNWVVNLVSGKSGDEEASLEESPVLELLEDATEVADEITDKSEDASDSTKKAETKLSAIGSFFSGIFESVGKVVTDISENFKGDNFVFSDSITTFLTGAGQFISAAFDAVGKLLAFLAKELKGEEIKIEDLTPIEQGLHTIFTKAGEFLGAFFSAVGDLLSEFTTTLKTNKKVIGKDKDGNEITEDISAMARIMEVVWSIFDSIIKVKYEQTKIELASGFLRDLGSKIFGTEINSMAEEIRDIGIGVAALSLALVALKTADLQPDEITLYGSWLISAIIAMSIFMSKLGESRKSAEQIEASATMNWNKVLTSLIHAVEMWAIVKTIMDALPTILDAIATTKIKLKQNDVDTSIGGEFLAVMGGIAIFLGAVAAAGIGFAAIQRISPGGLDPMATLSTIGSIVEIIGAAVIIIEAIQVVENLLQDAGLLDDEDGLLSFFADMGDTISKILTSLGQGIGKFIDAIGHGGMTKEERENRANAVAQQTFERLVALRQEMPIEELQQIVDMTEQLIGVYERLKGLGSRVDNQNIELSALDIAHTFRTISISIMEILTAFDTMHTESNSYFEQIIHQEDSIEEAGAQLDNANKLSKIDYSIWSNFAEGGQSYEAIQKMIELMSDIMGSINSLITPSVVNVFTLSQDKFDGFWERVDAFFNEGGFSDMIEYVKTGYATLNNAENELSAYTDQKYTDIISAINNLFSIFTNLMPKNQAAFDILAGSKDNYENWYFRIRNMLDWGPSGSQNDFEDLIKRVVEAYKKLGKYDEQLSGYKDMNFINAIHDIFSIFDVFAQDNGLGSTTWLDNYNEFSKQLKSSGFLEEYVNNVESIFEAFKKSTLYDAETDTFKNIYFNGTEIVMGLINAINEGFKNTNDLPAIDATGLGDAIVKALNVSENELKIAKAVHDMIQEGIIQMSEDPKTYGTYDTAGIEKYTSEIENLKGIVGQLIGENGTVDLSSIINIGDLSQLGQNLNGSFSIENILGETKEEFFGDLSEITKETSNLFTMTDPETGETKSFEEMANSVVGNVSSSFAQLEEIGSQAGEMLDRGLANGIATGRAIAAAQQLAKDISGSFTVSWQIQSPSKVFRQFGEYLDAGLTQGIESSSDKPVNAAEEMADESVANIKSILEGIRDLAIEDMDIEPTITPVVDMTNVNAAAAQIRMLGFNTDIPFTFDTAGLNYGAQSANPDQNRIQIEPINYSSEINSIRQDLMAMTAQMSRIPTILDGKRIVLDSGAIVGGIIDQVDSDLGRRGFYATREAY